jgi:hypothetical protein
MRVDADFRRVHLEIVILERILVLEQCVVHLPEPSLRTRCLCGFGSVLRVRMRLRERKMTEHESEAIVHHSPHILDDWMRTPAMRALEIAVLDERHRRCPRSDGVILFADGYYQMG